MFLDIKNNNKFVTYIFFVVLFTIGSLVFTDYGLGVDEDNSRINGFVSLKYIYEIFNPQNIHLIDKIISVPRACHS